MKICAWSDSHGCFPLEDLHIEECNIMFICGDIIPLKMQRNIPQSMSWIKKKFIPWCQSQPVNQIYVVAGNHDFAFTNEQEIKGLTIGTNITVLYNESAEYLDEDSGKIYTIWGTPLCHQFGNWAFMYSDEYNREHYELMPKNVDFLITHDAAFTHSDQCLGFNIEGDRNLHRGNIPLQVVIEEKKPKYHLFGHLHTCNHDIVDYNGTKTACVSLLNERYTLTYNPLYLEV